MLLTAGTFTAGANTFCAGATWTNNGGTFTPGAGTLTFNGTAAQTINGTASTQTFNHLTLAMITGLTLSSTSIPTSLTLNNLTLTNGSFLAPSTLNVTGIVSIGAGQSLTAAALSTINVGGNWVNNGTFAPGTGTVNFNGTGAQSISGGLSPTFNNLIIAKTVGQTLNASGLTSISVNNFTQSTGNFIAPATVTINGTILLSAGTYTAGTLTTFKGASWTNNGTTFTPGANTVNFLLNSAQTIGGTASTAFSTLSINNNVGVTLGFASTITTLTIGNTTAGSVFNDGGFAISTATTLNLTSGQYNCAAPGATAFPWGAATLTGQTVNYMGSAAQTVKGLNYTNLKINNAAGATLGADATVTTLTVGDITASSIFSDGGFTITTATTLNLTNGTYTCTTAAFPWAAVAISPGTTVNYARSGAQTVSNYGYWNLSLSGSGTKTFSAGNTNISGTLAISSGVVADLMSGSNDAVTILKLNGATQVSGTWGSTSSSPLATNTDNTYFGATTGYLTVAGSATLSTDYFRSTSVGNWSNPTTWQSSADGITNWVNSTLAPTSSAAGITIQSVTVTLDVNNQTASNLTIASGNLTLGSNNLVVSGNWTHNGGTLTPGTGTVTFDGTGAQTIAGTLATQTFNHIIIGNINTPSLSFGGSLTTLNIKGNWTNNAAFNAGTAVTIVLNGTLAQTIGGSSTSSFYKLTNSNATQPVSVTTNIDIANTLTAGTGSRLTPAAGVVFNSGGAAGTITSVTTGQFVATRIAATADFVSQYKFTTYTPGLSVNYAGAGNQTVNNTIGNYGFLELSGSGTATLADAIVINNDITLTSGTLDVSGSNFAITASGHWINNGGTLDPRTGTLTFNGATTQSIKGTATSQTFYNVVLAKTAGQLLNTAGSTVAITLNNLTQTTGNFTVPATLTVNNNLALNGGTLTAGSGTINIGGTFTNGGGTFTAGSGNVNFNGTLAQTVPVFVYNNLISNNAAGVSLSANTTITKVIIGSIVANSIFNDGGFTITTATNLTLTNGTYNMAVSPSTAWGSWTFNGAGTTVAYISASPQTTAAVTYQNLTFSGAGTKTVVNNTNISLNWNVGSPTTINAAAATTTTGNITGSGIISMTTGTINIKGDWTNTGVMVPGTGTVNFNGTGAQAINTSLASMTFANLTVTKTAATLLTVGGSTTTLSAANFVETSGDFTAPATMNVSGLMTLTAGTFTAGTQLNYGGATWSKAVANTFVAGAGTVTFNGTVQSLGGAGATTFNIFNVNNGATVTTTQAENFTTLNIGQGASGILNIGGVINTVTGTTTINNGATLNTAAAGAKNFGTVVIASGGSFINTTTGSIFCSGNWTNNGGTFTPATGTVTFNGTVAQAINGAATTQTFYNVTLALTPGQTLDATAVSTLLTVGNIFTETTGNFIAPASLTINGNVVLTAGTFNAGTAITFAGSIWTNNGTTVNPGSGTVTFTRPSAQTINGTSTSQTFYNVAVAMTAGQTLTATAVNTSLTMNNLTLTTGNFSAPILLNINGNLSIASGQTLTALAASTINVGGNWSNSGTFTPTTTGTVTFNGTGTQTIGGTVVAPVFNNITVAKTAGSLLDASGLTSLTLNANYIQTSGNFTSPATLIVGNALNTAVVTITAGTFTAGASTTFKGNNWTNNGATFVPGAGANFVDLNNTVATSLGGSASTTFNELKITNAAGVTLGFASTIDKLTFGAGGVFYDGGFVISTANTITLSTGTYHCAASGATAFPWGTATVNGGTVNYNGGSAQTIKGGLTYLTLKVNNIIGATPGANITATTLTIGDIALNSKFNDGAFTIATATTCNLTSGTYTVTAATFPWVTLNAGVGSTVNYALAGAQAVAVKTYSNLTLSGSGSKSITSASTITNGLFTITGSAQAVISTGISAPVNGSLILGVANMSPAGTWGATLSPASNKNDIYFLNSGTPGTLNVATTVTLATYYFRSKVTGNWSTPATWESSADGVTNWGVATLAPTSAAASIDIKTGITTLDVNSQTASNIVLSTGTLLFTNSNNLIVTGNWTNNGGTFTQGAGTVTFDGTGTQTINGTAATHTFNNLTIGSSNTPTLDFGGSITTLSVRGNWTNNANFTAGVAVTVSMDGTTAQTIGGTAITSFYKLTNTNTTQALSVVINTNVSNTLTAGTGSTLNPSAGVVFNNAGAAGTITSTTTGIFKATRTAATADFVSQYKFTTYTAGLNVNYSGSGNQTVNSAVSYLNLTLSSLGTATLQGNTTVTGDLTINSGILDVSASNFGITLSGNWNNNVNAAAFNPRAGTVTFSGALAQSLTGTANPQTFYGLTINKSALANTLTVGPNMSLTNLTSTLGTLISTGGTLNIAGNWTYTGTLANAPFTNNGGTVNFNGTSAQTTPGVAGLNFNQLKVNNPVGLTLGNNCTILGIVVGDITSNSVFNDGAFTITTKTDLTIDNGSAYNTQAATWQAWTNYYFNFGKNTTVGYTAPVITQTVAAIPGGYPNLLCSGSAKTLTANVYNPITPAYNGIINGDWTNNATSTIGAKVFVTGSIAGTGVIAMAANRLYFGGNWTNTGVTTFTTGAVVVSGTLFGGTKSTAPQYINTSMATMSFPGITLYGGDLIIAGSTTTLNTITDSLISGTLTAGTALNINVSGNWVNQQVAGSFVPGIGTVTFNGSVAQKLCGAATDVNFYNIVVNNSAGSTVTVGNPTTPCSATTPGISYIAMNDFTLTKGSFIFAAVNVVYVYGDVLFSAGAGTFTAGITNLSCGGNDIYYNHSDWGTDHATIYVGGDWTNNTSVGAFVPSTSVVVMGINDGILRSQTIGGTFVTTFYDLVINHTTTTLISDIKCTNLNVGWVHIATLNTGTFAITLTGAVDPSANFKGMWIQGGSTLRSNGAITCSWDWYQDAANGFIAGTTSTVSFTVAGAGLTRGIIGNDPKFYNLTIAGATATSKLSCEGVNPLTVLNNVTLTSGIFHAYHQDFNGTMYVGGNWSKTLAAVFTHNYVNVIFNGTAAQAIQGTATTQTFYDIQISNISPGIVNLIAGTTVNVIHDLTIDSDASLSAGTGVAAATFNIGHSWINNGGIFTPYIGTVSFYGSSVNGTFVVGSGAIGDDYNRITGSGTGVNQTFYNITVNNTETSGYQYLLARTGDEGINSLTLNGNFAMTKGGFYAPATMNVTGNVTLAASNTVLGIPNTFYPQSGNLYIQGNWANNGVGPNPGSFDFWDNGGKVIFNGTAAQTIGGTVADQSFNDLVSANSHASGVSVLAAVTSLTTVDNFTLQSGLFTTNTTAATKTIFIQGASPNAFTLTAGSFVSADTVYINGQVSQIAGTITSTGTVKYQNYDMQNVAIGTYNNLFFYDYNNNAEYNKVLLPGTILINNIFRVGPGAPGYNGTATGYITTGNTIQFNKTTTQNIPTLNFDGTATGTGYNNLTFITSVKALVGNIAVGGTLTFPNLAATNVDLSLYNLTIGETGVIAGAPSATHMIKILGTGLGGRLIKRFNTGTQTCLYPIGTGTTYLPVTLTFNNVTTAGHIGATFTRSTTHPNADNAYATSPGNWFKEFWTFDRNGTGFAFDYYSAKMDYAGISPTDYNSPNLTAAQESTMGARIWNGTNWLDFISSSRTTKSPTVAGINRLGDLTFTTCVALAKVADPSNQSGCASGSSTVNFTVTYSGTPSTFQWYENGVSLGAGSGVYSGTQTGTLTLTNPTIALNNKTYYCIATGVCGGGFTTNAATFTVVAGLPNLPILSVSPTTYRPGDTVVLTATETSGYTSTNFLWREFFPESGGTFVVVQDNASPLTKTNVSAYGTSIKSPGVTWMFVSAHNGCGSTTSTFYQFSVIPPTTFTNPTTCGGTDGTIKFAGLRASGQYNVNYSKNAVPQAQVTLTASVAGLLTLPNLGVGTYSNITLVALGVGSSSVSAPADPVTLISPTLPIPTLSGNAIVCIGVTGNVYTTESGKSSYTWSVIGGSITSGGGSADNTATVTWTTDGEQSISVNYTDGNGCSAIAPVQNNVTVSKYPNLVVTNQTECSPTIVNITETSTNNPLPWTDANSTVGTTTYYTSNAFAIAGTPEMSSPDLISTNGTYYIRRTTTVGGCTDIKPITATINICIITWLGTTSDRWDIAANWNSGTIPTAANDVVIPGLTALTAQLPTAGVAPRIPAAYSTAAVKNIAFENDVQLTIEAGTSLQVKGNWDVEFSLTIQGTGSVIFNSTTAAQTITSGITSFPYLRLNNTNSGLTISPGAGKQFITRALELEKGVLTTNNKLELSSDASNTAYINDFQFGGIPGSLSGNVTIRRHVAGVIGYRYLSSPVVTSPSIDVTAFGPSVRGIDGLVFNPLTSYPSNNTFPTCWVYNENDPNPLAQSGWVSKTAAGPANKLEAGTGYAVIIQNSQTLSFTGTVYTNTVNPFPSTLTLTSSGTPASDGWHLLGNPFPSPISWTAFYNANNLRFISAVKRWKTGGNYSGQYSDYTAAGVGVNGAMPNIAIGQGFLVKVVNQGTYSYPNSCRIADPTTDFNDWDPITTVNNLIRLKIAGGAGADEAVVYFDPNATDVFDEKFDAIKMLSGTLGMPGLYTTTGGDMSINVQGAFTTNREIPLNMYVDVNGSYNLSVLELMNFEPTAMVYLEDRSRGTFTNIREVQELSYNLTKGYVNNRFFLHFSAPLSIQATAESCNRNDGKVKILNPGASSWNISLQTSTGEVVETASVVSADYEFTGLADGNYTVKFETETGYVVYQQVAVEAGQNLNTGFTASTQVVSSGSEVEFTAELNAPNTTYFWNFGDEIAVNAGAVVQHTYDAPGIYTVSLSLSSGACTSVTEHSISVLSTTTSIANTDGERAFKLYPNPATELISIQLSDASKFAPEWIEIQDVAGRTISHEIAKDMIANGRKTLNVSNLANGVYQIVLGTKDARFVRSFVVAH